MKKIILWSLLICCTAIFVACQQEVQSPQEIIFIANQNDDQQDATIELEAVFVAKAKWQKHFSSQVVEQNHFPTSQSRGSGAKTSPKPSQKKPQIRIPKDVFDFGFVDEGELVTHSFRLYNDGPSTWVIEEILPSCGCTEVKATAREIVSGAYVDISFNLETTGRPGSQQKLIEIFSNAGYHRLLIKGVVYPPKFSQENPSQGATMDSI